MCSQALSQQYLHKEEKHEDVENNDVMLEAAPLYGRKMVFVVTNRQKHKKNASFRPRVEQKQSGLSDKNWSLNYKIYYSDTRFFASLRSDSSLCPWLAGVALSCEG